MMTDSPIPASGAGWTRGRVVFLGVSGAVVLGIVFSTHEVLLPFLLAIITAYVLTPAVAFCERYRVPRGAAIILVYAVTIGILYCVIAAIAPRIVVETQGFARESPAMVRRLVSEWAPMFEQRVRAVLDQVGEPPPEPADTAPALQVVKEADGSFSVRLASGVDVVQEGPKLWRLKPAC
ncbi:MAG TPA: AI-2E family transporter, partial [Polyangiaceae bacterium]|nr:AI-2E family transporter [Polyangiaceae bacterium]